MYFYCDYVHVQCTCTCIPYKLSCQLPVLAVVLHIARSGLDDTSLQWNEVHSANDYVYCIIQPKCASCVCATKCASCVCATMCQLCVRYNVPAVCPLQCSTGAPLLVVGTVVAILGRSFSSERHV